MVLFCLVLGPMAVTVPVCLACYKPADGKFSCLKVTSSHIMKLQWEVIKAVKLGTASFLKSKDYFDYLNILFILVRLANV